MTMQLFSAMFAVLAALTGTISSADAQQVGVNVRGTIEAFDGKVLQVKTRAGSAAAVTLPEGVNVSITQPFTLADVKPGMVLGVTTIKRPDGKVVAIDVRPIPPAAAQGLSPYDLAPDSTMTNASVTGVVTGAEGQELSLDYKTGTVTAIVTPQTAMSRAAAGSRDDLKPGETVYVFARPDASGALTAVRVQVSKNGVKPTQ